MEKITLVCTSLNADFILLRKMVRSAKWFDEMLVHIDGEGGEYYKDNEFSGSWKYPVHLNITDAYNKLIGMATTEWICCFCDDDYFYSENLCKMVEKVHKGIDADVAHFKFHVSGYIPPQDKRCWFGHKEYDLCEKNSVTSKLLEKHNRLPAGSFFRKNAWKKVGGFQGDKCHDWDLWKRMVGAGCRFKYFDYLVYNFVRRENSAWIIQNKT